MGLRWECFPDLGKYWDELPQWNSQLGKYWKNSPNLGKRWGKIFLSWENAGFSCTQFPVRDLTGNVPRLGKICWWRPILRYTGKHDKIIHGYKINHQDCIWKYHSILLSLNIACIWQKLGIPLLHVYASSFCTLTYLQQVKVACAIEKGLTNVPQQLPQETCWNSQLGIIWEYFPFLGKAWDRKFLSWDIYGKIPLCFFSQLTYMGFTWDNNCLKTKFQYWEKLGTKYSWNWFISGNYLWLAFFYNYCTGNSWEILVYFPNLWTKWEYFLMYFPNL